jgi:hypothetical protein
MSIVISLPFPHASLFPNRRAGKHWGATHAEKVTAREDAFYAAKQAQGGFVDDGKPIPVSIVFCAPDNRRRDLDGCLSAMKPALDGIAAALGVDDSRFRPILIDAGTAGKPGAAIVAVGVSIITTAGIE